MIGLDTGAGSADTPDQRLLAWRGPAHERMISLVFGRQFAIDRDGACVPTPEFELQEQLVHRDGPAPSLARDSDLYAWRERTDLVIQGIARSLSPTTRIDINLRCGGSRIGFEVGLVVHGDRRVERGPTGLRLSPAKPFHAMPLSYKRAYGGVDELDGASDHSLRRAHLVREVMGPNSPGPVSPSCYPRNPTGSGYVVNPDSAVGTAWPNIEFRDEQLSIEDLVVPASCWGRRPYPAGFDWFSHRWFPRCVLLGMRPAAVRAIDAVPARELSLGILDEDHLERSSFGRVRHQFAQGAHPYLWRWRFHGDEVLVVDALGHEGGPLVVRLPGLEPKVNIRPLGGRARVLRAVLDLVYVEAEHRRVSLVWRVSVPVDRDPLPFQWPTLCPYEIRW